MAKLNAYAVTSRLTDAQIRNTVVNLLNKAQARSGTDTFSIVGTLDKKLYMMFSDSMVRSNVNLTSNVIDLLPDFTSIENRLTALENNRVSAGNSSIPVINTSALEGRISVIEQKSAANVSKIAALETKILALEAKVADLTKANAALAAELKTKVSREDVLAMISSNTGSGVIGGGSEEGPVIPQPLPQPPEEQEVVIPGGTVPDPGQDTSGSTDIVDSEESSISKLSYWGVVTSENPTAEEIKGLANKEELSRLAGKQIDIGGEDDEGLCAFAFPASLTNGGQPTYTNRLNNFSQVPLATSTVNIDGVDYRVDVFEYSYGAVPFILS